MQRERYRNLIFHSDADRLTYLAELFDLCRRLGCAVYGYCLMPNHVHLIVRLPNSATLRLLINGLGNLYRHGSRPVRGAPSSSTSTRTTFSHEQIDSDTYLMTCLRYVELNPVRANMKKNPQDYRWSSYRARIGLAPSGLDQAPCHLALGETLGEQQARYRRFVETRMEAGPSPSVPKAAW
jgi:putative transposase